MSHKPVAINYLLQPFSLFRSQGVIKKFFSVYSFTNCEALKRFRFKQTSVKVSHLAGMATHGVVQHSAIPK